MKTWNRPGGRRGPCRRLRRARRRPPTSHTNVTGEYGKEGTESVRRRERLPNRLSEREPPALSLLRQQDLRPQQNRPRYRHHDPRLPGRSIARQGRPCGDRDFDVDNTNGASKNNLYPVPSTEPLFAFNSAGTQLGGTLARRSTAAKPAVSRSPAPAKSGAATTGGTRDQQIQRATGPRRARSPPEQVCKLAVDRTNNDLFTVNYGGGALTKYTAASGYATSMRSARPGRQCRAGAQRSAESPLRGDRGNR